MSTNPANTNLDPCEHKFTGLFIGTPCMTGSPRHEYSISLEKTVLLFEARGLHVEHRFDPHDSLVMRARCMLASWFMDTNCSHMLCIDDDLRWYPQDVLRMLEVDKAFVCGAYRKKSDDESYAVKLRPEDEQQMVVCPHCGCVEVLYANIGFALIHRSVFERMFAAYPELKCGHPDEQKVIGRHFYGLFLEMIENGKLWGEDYAFARRWADIGGRMWLDPSVTLTHYGVKGWTGDIARWFQRKDEKPLVVGDDWKCIQGWLTDQQAAVLVDQVKALPENGVILELGSWRGRSTAVLGMAAAEANRGLRVYAVDHFEGSPEERSTFHHDATIDPDGVYPDFLQNLGKLGVLGRTVIPIRADFAEALSDIENESVDFVFFDGDHTEDQTLKTFLRIKSKVKPGGVVVFHDYNWPGVRAAIEVLRLTVTEAHDMAIWRKPRGDDE